MTSQLAMATPLRAVPEPRAVDPVAAEAAAAAFLAALGVQTDNEGREQTPGRMARAYAEMLAPRPFTMTTFPNDEGYDELVLARSVPVQSLCEHHMLPFIGIAHVGYLPGERILGLSKLARVVEMFARRPQVQERLTAQIAHWLDENLAPRGVGVVLQAEHLCMSLRGVRAHGALTVTSALREEGYDGPVTLVGEEPHHPYERPPLSKAYLHGTADRASLLVHPQDWYAAHDVDLRLNVVATAIDRDQAEVILTDGERIPYDRLLLTTGSAPNWLRVPGAHLAGVHYLRRVEDSDRIKAAFARGPRVVIIGGGWIGLETAAAARAAGLEVTILEQGSLPLLGILGPELAQMFANLHRDNGVHLQCDAQVTEIVGTDGTVTGVRLDDNRVLPADVVLIGVGISPNTELAGTAGLLVANGIVVDEHLATADPAIFAAGDVANAHHPFLRRHIRVEHWANAERQPAVAARSMMGRPARYDRLPYFYTDQYDLGMEYTGYVAPDDDAQVVVRGDLDKRELVAFWLKDGRVLAGMNVNVWEVTAEIERLVTSRARVDPDRLADPDVPWSDLTG